MSATRSPTSSRPTEKRNRSADRDGKLRLLEPGDVIRDVPLQQGVPDFRKAGVEHDVINPNAGEFAFIEVEIR
jgi:hypothetical protein